MYSWENPPSAASPAASFIHLKNTCNTDLPHGVAAEFSYGHTEVFYLWITSQVFIYLCFLVAPLVMAPKYAHTELLEETILWFFSYHINSCSGTQTSLSRIVGIVMNSDTAFNEMNYLLSATLLELSSARVTA